MKKLKDMDLHDKVVYRVAENLLEKGSESIEIGDRVEDRISICSKLIKKYPARQIFTYLDNYKIEFLSPRKLRISP